MKIYPLVLLLSIVSLHATQMISASVGYEHADVSFGFDESSSLLETVQESWHDIGSFFTKLDYKFSKQNVVYAHSTLSYAKPLSDHPSCFFTRRNSTEKLQFLARGYSYEIAQKIGYPFRLGPLECAPFTGFSFEDMHWKRRKVFPVLIDGALIQPKKRLRLKNLMPLVGCTGSYQPWRTEAFIIKAAYTYFFGSSSLHS